MLSILAPLRASADATYSGAVGRAKLGRRLARKVISQASLSVTSYNCKVQ
jgi:hypothetical protein